MTILRELSPAAFAFLRDERAQDLVEYALLGSLLALGAVASMHHLATGVSRAFRDIRRDLNSAVRHHR